MLPFNHNAKECYNVHFRTNKIIILCNGTFVELYYYKQKLYN